MNQINKQKKPQKKSTVFCKDGKHQTRPGPKGVAQLASNWGDSRPHRWKTLEGRAPPGRYQRSGGGVTAYAASTDTAVSVVPTEGPLRVFRKITSL